MDKNIIRKHLTDTFIKEAATPGIELAKTIKGKEEKINKDGVKKIDKDMSAYDKDLKQEAKGTKNMAVNKFNYTDDAEKTYHDQMETLNGLEMTKYASDTGEGFRDRAQKAIEGDTIMGNAKAANAEATWGASSDNFGKDLTKRIKSSEAKRDDAFIATYELGDKIMALPDEHKVQKSSVAIGKNASKGDKTKTPPTQSLSEGTTENKKTNNNMKRLNFKKEFNGVGNALKLIPESYKVDNKEFEMTDGNESYRIRWEGSLTEGRAVIITAANKTMVNEDIERMKALFNYKSEDTLGLVKGNKRLDENTAFTDVWNKTKKLLNEQEEEDEMVEESENIDGQTPDKTGPWEEAGTAVAPEVPAVHKKKLQEKDGTAPSAPTKDADDAVSVAPEVPAVHKKKLQSGKDGTAPAPKEGPWEEASVNEAENIDGKKASKTAPFEEAGTPVAPEVPSVHKKKLQDKDGTAPAASVKDADKSVSVAPEVPAVHKKSLQKKDGTVDNPKEDEWENANVPQAPEAKKHVHMHEEVEMDEEDKIAEEFDELKKKL